MSRAEAIAKQVALRGPDVLALQEVTQLRRQSPGDAIIGGTIPATEVSLDYLAILLGELERHGAHYGVACLSNNLDVEVPLATGPGTFDDLRLTDRDVILIRTDLPPDYMRASNPQSGNYTAALTLPIGISVYRGWCSVDLEVRNRAFRIIDTHLEEALSESLPDIQGYQAAELLTGPANTNLPVILSGDFNSDAYGNYGPSVYPLLTTYGGFQDAWSVARPGESGFTWGHDDLLSDPSVALSLRIDHVLYRGWGDCSQRGRNNRLDDSRYSAAVVFRPRSGDLEAENPLTGMAVARTLAAMPECVTPARLLPPIRRQDFLPHPDRLRCRFDILVIAHELDGLLQIHDPRRDQSYRFIGRRCAHIRELLFLHDVHVQIHVARVLTHDHPFVDFGSGRDEDLPAFLQIPDRIRRRLPCAICDKRSRRSRRNFSLPGHISAEQRIDDCRSARVGQ